MTKPHDKQAVEELSVEEQAVVDDQAAAEARLIPSPDLEMYRTAPDTDPADPPPEEDEEEVGATKSAKKSPKKK